MGQYDLERASTWAMIGSGERSKEVSTGLSGERSVRTQLVSESGGGQDQPTPEIDYKKVM